MLGQEEEQAGLRLPGSGRFRDMGTEAKNRSGEVTRAVTEEVRGGQKGVISSAFLILANGEQQQGGVQRLPCRVPPPHDRLGFSLSPLPSFHHFFHEEAYLHLGQVGEAD